MGTDMSAKELMFTASSILSAGQDQMKIINLDGQQTKEGYVVDQEKPRAAGQKKSILFLRARPGACRGFSAISTSIQCLWGVRCLQSNIRSSHV